MASPIFTIFEAFLGMPYYKNHAAASGAVHNHARSTKKLLLKLWFPTDTQSMKVQEKLKKNEQGQEGFLAEMPTGSFIEQPFGTHSSPDFFIKAPDGKIVPLEAKSSETALHPTYNSGGVKRGYYYVFCSKKTNTTTIYRGDDIISQEQERMIAEYIEECRARDAVFNQRLR